MPDMKACGPLLHKTVEAVREAGEIIRRHWTQPREITRKGRIDLVTQTDVAVEKALKVSLAEVLPGSDFLAEESAAGMEPGELTWVIDPLDGTTNYAHSLPLVAVSVGLWKEGRPEIGVIYIPMLDEMFCAERGSGAFLNGESLRVSGEADLVDTVVATGFPYTVREDIGPILARLESVLVSTQGVRRMGAAAVDLAYTACGRFGGFYETGLKPWDTCAGWLLVEEAGGRVTQFDGSPYHLNAEGILASNSLLHEDLSGLLQGAEKNLE